MSASREKNKRKELNASAEAPATPAKKGMSKGLKWTIGIICLVLVIAIVTFFSMLTSGYLAGHRRNCGQPQALACDGELFL